MEERTAKGYFFIARQRGMRLARMPYLSRLTPDKGDGRRNEETVSLYDWWIDEKYYGENQEYARESNKKQMTHAPRGHGHDALGHPPELPRALGDCARFIDRNTQQFRLRLANSDSRQNTSYPTHGKRSSLCYGCCGLDRWQCTRGRRNLKSVLAYGREQRGGLLTTTAIRRGKNIWGFFPGREGIDGTDLMGRPDGGQKTGGYVRRPKTRLWGRAGGQKSQDFRKIPSRLGTASDNFIERRGPSSFMCRLRRNRPTWGTEERAEKNWLGNAKALRIVPDCEPKGRRCQVSHTRPLVVVGGQVIGVRKRKRQKNRYLNPANFAIPESN